MRSIMYRRCGRWRRTGLGRCWGRAGMPRRFGEVRGASGNMAEVTDERGEVPPAAVGRRTARGFAWLTAQTLGAKAVGFVGQIILAWYLAPDDFGLVGLALTVAAFAGLIQQAGLKEILIHRHRH